MVDIEAELKFPEMVTADRMRTVPELSEMMVLKRGNRFSITPVTKEEYEIMKTHPVRGANIMGPIRQLREVIPGMKHHHERWDGSGYPEGLSGEDIPLAARIVEKGALALDPRGTMYDKNNIGQLLDMRNFMDSLRGSGVETGGPSSFGQRERMKFANELDKFIARG